MSNLAPQNKTLLEWTAEIFEIMEQLQSYHDRKEVPPQELQDALTNVMTAQAEKVDRCASFVKRAETDIEWLQKEKEQIDKLISRRKWAIDRMKQVAEVVMDAEGTRKLEGMKGHFFAKRQSKAVVIENIDLVPEKYCKLKTMAQADKAAIKSAIENGATVPGTKLITKDSITVK